MFEPIEVMRQKDDLQFALLLNRLREGQHTQGDLDLLTAHVRTESPAIEHISHLFTTKKEVEEYNGELFRNAGPDLRATIRAADWVIGVGNAEMQANILSRVSKDSSKTMGLLEELKLVIDMPAEITNNVSVQDGVTNGSSCTLRMFDYRVLDSDRVSIVWVEFEDKEAGKELRTELLHLYHPGIARTWTPILEITRQFTVRSNNIFHVKRKQFPLQLAAARTIHKAQGSTLRHAVVHFGSRKNDHIHYVGLSRVTCIENLHILKLNADKISVSTQCTGRNETVKI